MRLVDWDTRTRWHVKTELSEVVLAPGEHLIASRGSHCVIRARRQMPNHNGGDLLFINHFNIGGAFDRSLHLDLLNQNSALDGNDREVGAVLTCRFVHRILAITEVPFFLDVFDIIEPLPFHLIQVQQLLANRLILVLFHRF